MKRITTYSIALALLAPAAPAAVEPTAPAESGTIPLAARGMPVDLDFQGGGNTKGNRLILF
jgi:hypothetical protein